jgi:hypothetical protein
MNKVENMVGYIRDDKLVMETGLANQDARWGKKMITTYQTITQCCRKQNKNKNIHCYRNQYDHSKVLMMIILKF